MNANTPATNPSTMKTRLPILWSLSSTVSSSVCCRINAGVPRQGLVRRLPGRGRHWLWVGLALLAFGGAVVSRGVAGESSRITTDPDDGERLELVTAEISSLWRIYPPSPRILGVVRQPDGVALVRTLGWPGVTYQLEVSDDLVEWRRVGEARMGNGRFLTIEDPEAVGTPLRFYRFEVSARTAPIK